MDYAAIFGDISTLKLLFSHGGDPLLQQPPATPRNMTLLQYAIPQYSYEVSQFLIDHGVDINEVNAVSFVCLLHYLLHHDMTFCCFVVVFEAWRNCIALRYKVPQCPFC